VFTEFAHVVVNIWLSSFARILALFKRVLPNWFDPKQHNRERRSLPTLS